MRVLLVFLLLLPNAGAALEYCDELWFTRNLVFHKAGHCFGSQLGKSLFGNDGCNSAGAELKKSDIELIARVKAAEAEEGCKIDTSRSFAPIILPAQRLALVDVPFPSMYESACIGWRGKSTSLHAGHSSASQVIGTIRQGDVLLFQFDDAGDWSFVEITINGVTVMMGWARLTFAENSCDLAAG